MGIVVAIFMLLAWLALSPWTPAALARLLRHPQLRSGMGIGVLVAGLWNVLWHGLRHLSQFWGQAALVSGLFMVLAAVLMLARPGADTGARPALATRLEPTIRPARPLVLLGLLACFLLYAVTLIRLNLGYPILG
ncbi:hypothetical protein [Hydrogenophaga sp.]|uniref:hypothetical protein n=1 Tax=Hydrogenophaga sp. TaxID=1904254 RepID=UPI0035692936